MLPRKRWGGPLYLCR